MKYNPKALNLEAIKNSEKNVTLGFKCEPELKLLLAEEAHEAGLTLSLYVKKLVTTHYVIQDTTTHTKPINLALKEQHRNTRHDAVDKIMEITERWGETHSFTACEAMLNEITGAIINLKQREPDL